MKRICRPCLGMLSALVLTGAAGCSRSDGNAPPTPDQSAQQIQNNSHIPPQAKAAAQETMNQMRQNQMRGGASGSPR